MRKQSKAQIIGREGERWFHSVLPPEWSIQKPLDDFGIDGIVAVGTETHLSPVEFGVQIKSSSQFKTVGKKIVVPNIGKDELLYWSRKFYPTLLIAYDTKRKVGYFDWICNISSPEDLRKNQDFFYLHIDSARVVSHDCWPRLKAELEAFHMQFANAFHAKFELLPVIITLASLLRNLCASTMADKETRDGLMLYVTAQAWTHIEVITQLDLLIPKTAPDSLLKRILAELRKAYFGKCDQIFLDFSKLVQSSDATWIMMKKPEHSGVVLNELTAML